MHILLDPEKVEKYSKYVEALAEVRDYERTQMANHDRLEYTKWYLSHKEELDGLASTLSINKNQLELKQSQRDSLKLTIDNMQISLERLTSNKLKEFLHKVTIGDVQAKLENLRGELRTVNEDIKILEATRDGAYHRVEELIGELRGVISNQAFQSVYNSYIMPNRSSEFRFSYYAGNLPELEAREEELKAATSQSKQKLNEVKMSMTPEMREEAERNGFFLGTILNVKNRRVRYDLTPYASLVILKVLSDARHLPPEELFKQIEPEGDYDTFSAAVQARIERFLENNSVLGETRAQKAVEDKFKRFEPLRGEPLPVKPLEAETKQEEVPLPGEPNFEEGNPFGLN